MKELITVDGDGVFQVAWGYVLADVALMSGLHARHSIALLVPLSTESQSDILIDVGSLQRPQSIVRVSRPLLVPILQYSIDAKWQIVGDWICASDLVMLIVSRMC